MTDLSEKNKQLSKHLSYILRHHPEKADLELDPRGFTNVNKLLRSLKDTKYSWVDRDDLENLIEKSDKQRFEIKSDKIRALYGHSVDVKVDKDTEPPKTLYHGTSPKSLDSILKEGLKPMNRQHVHLSKTKKEAYKVGKRHHSDPVILSIDAKSAWKDGISFYETPDVFLVDKLPPKYISIDEK